MNTIIKVESSTINKVKYNSENNELFVTFKNNTEYKYSDVPQSIFDDFISAESVGKYFSQHIKSGYKYEKI